MSFTVEVVIVLRTRCRARELPRSAVWKATPAVHESLGVTLAYLKGKDAESEEALEHSNNSSVALYA